MTNYKIQYNLIIAPGGKSVYIYMHMYITYIHKCINIYIYIWHIYGYEHAHISVHTNMSTPSNFQHVKVCASV